MEGPVCLKGHRFRYDGYADHRQGAVANIEVCPGEEVWGLLVELETEDWRLLDAWEGFPVAYQRKEVRIRRDGNVCRALAYARPPRKPDVPHPAYRRVIVEGARYWGLPRDYIKRVLEADRVFP